MAYTKLNHNFAQFLEPSYYADIIKKEDDASCVLKLHLLCERFLNLYLEETITNEQKEFFEVGKGKGKQLLKYFNEKMQVSIALGLPLEIARPLKEINKIRNSFANQFDATLEPKLLDLYCNEIDNFKPYVPTEGEWINAPVSSQKVTTDGKIISAKDGAVAAFTIATYIFINKASIWLVNDLNARGQLRTG